MSLTNKLVANIKQTNVDIGQFINTNNVICIDTSYNRIGINTKTPRYSIDICGNDGKICVHNIEVINNATFTTISCNTISGNTISCNTISCNTISGNTIRCIDGSFINLDTSFINFKTISGSLIGGTTILGICGNIEELFGKNITISNKLTALSISAENISATKFVQEIGDFSNINIIKNTKTNISGGSITAVSISCENLYAQVMTSQTLSSGIIKTNELMSASGDLYFTLSGNIFYLNTDLGPTSQSRIQTIIGSTNRNLITTNLLTASGGNFIDCSMDNCNVNYTLTVRNITFSTGGYGIQLQSKSSYGIIRSLEADTTFGNGVSSLVFHDGTDIPSNIFTKTHYATLDLSINSLKKHINRPLLDNYRYIPLKFKSINNKLAKTELFFIPSTPPYHNNTIDISNTTLKTAGIYEINASVTVSYTNIITGDVEPNDYTFGLYNSYAINSNIVSQPNNNNFDTCYNYVKNRNLILAFDNSFNYSTTSIQYIGPLLSIIDEENNNNGLCYMISSQKDISYLNVEHFSSTIKLLNY